MSGAFEPQVIHLDADDDIVSVRDRLDYRRCDRVLLVVSDDGRLRLRRLDMALLRRHAETLGADVGVVSRDRATLRLAREVGLPAFKDLDSARHHRARRAWWRARGVPRPGLGRDQLALTPDEAPAAAIHQAAAALPPWRVWAARYAAVLVVLATLLALGLALAYTVPGATVTLAPTVQTVRVARTVAADPALEQVDFAAGAVPARPLAVTVEWEAAVDASGEIEIADVPARGEVIFTNLFSETVTIPPGTTVFASSRGDASFQTLRAVSLPDVVDASVTAEVVAVEPGVGGNVGPGQIDRVDGPLRDAVSVRNESAVQGGSVRTLATVAEADLTRVRAQVLQTLQSLAASEMSSILRTNEFLAQDSLRLGVVEREAYSHRPGEQSDSLTLVLRAEMLGTAIDISQANAIIFEALAAAVQEGFVLVPDTIQVENGGVVDVDAAGRVELMVIGEALVAAELAVEPLLPIVAGQPIDVAAAYLYQQLPLREHPVVQVQPNWFDRVPYLPGRIDTRVVAAHQRVAP